MSLLDIVIYPDPRLRAVCDEVPEVTPEIQQLLDDMAETMYEAPGIGLAAPQVGVLKRVIVVDVSMDYENQGAHLYKLVNPEVIHAEGEIEMEEGCLSLPGVHDYVRRPASVVVEALNEKGEKITIEAEDLLSVCLQHEIDHLDGVLFIDYLSKLKRNLMKKQLLELAAPE